MATYTVQSAVATGLTPTANAVSASDDFTNDGRTVLRVVNGSGGSLTVTAVTSYTQDGMALADNPVTVADGVTKIVGPFPVRSYGSTTTVQYSATSSVTAECVKVG